MLLAMVWFSVLCAMFYAVRAMVMQGESIGDTSSRAMWGRSFIAIVAGAWGAMSARRAGKRPAKIMLQGTLYGAAAATIVVTALAVEIATGFGEFYPDYFQWSRDWPMIVELVLYQATLLGAILAALVSLLWLLRPAWRYAISATLLTLAGAFWILLSAEIDRARLEKEALDKVAGNMPYVVDYGPISDRWFMPGPKTVSYLQRESRERVFETVVGLRVAGLVPSMEIGRNDDWSQLPKLKNLRRLFFEHRRLEDDEFANVAKLPQLEELWLMGVRYCDADLETLRGMHCLRVLTLTDTQITPAGEARLQRALPQCKIEHRASPPLRATDPDAAPAPPPDPDAP